MKCPKCNYVSHDYLDVCRKCGRDLVAFKQEIGLLVLQPGALDLGLVLGGAEADDLFESVEEEVIMHTSDDDDFDISLDDYADRPGARGAPAGAPRASGRATEEDSAGLDHLTLELDASELPAELTARLRAAQALPDTSPPSRPAAPPPAVPGEIGLPGHVTLDMDPGSISAELPPGALEEIASVSPPLPPPVPETTAAQDITGSLRLDVSNIDFAPTTPPAGTIEEPERAESVNDATTMPELSGAMASLQMQDVVLAEETPAAPEAQEPEVVDPTIPTVELLDVEVAVAPSEAETRATPPEADAAVSTSLNSFELSVDDSLFASQADAPPSSAIAEVAETTLPDLPMPTLDDPTFTFTAEDVPLTPLSQELTATAAEVTADDTLASLDDTLVPLDDTLPPSEDTLAPPGDMLTSSDMLALQDLEESTLAGHLTLEMSAPELPEDLMSSLFEDAEPTSPPDDPTTPGATPSAGPEQGFTTSDALALGDLDDITLPGHLTLELDLAEITTDLSSTTIDDLQRADPPGDVQPKTSPPQSQAGDEEELLLDLDDVEVDDDKQT